MGPRVVSRSLLYYRLVGVTDSETIVDNAGHVHVLQTCDWSDFND